jgi:ubiquinone/menaquinone biosynthesis C-methylase UbiE
MSEEITSIYDKVAFEISEVYNQQTHIKGISNFSKTLSQKARILDLGCGSGKDVFLFRKLGFEAVGIDGSKGMIAESRRRFPKEKFLVMDVRNLKFPDEFFDAVWSWSVLTHLKMDDKIVTLKEILRV